MIISQVMKKSHVSKNLFIFLKAVCLQETIIMFVIAMKRRNVFQCFTLLLTNVIVIMVILFKEKIKLEFLTRYVCLKLFSYNVSI